MIDYEAIVEYKNEYILFMEKMDYLIDHSFLMSINDNEKNNILFQILLTIYTMNHTHSIYFNDLYSDMKIKNIMVIKNKNEKI